MHGITLNAIGAPNASTVGVAEIELVGSLAPQFLHRLPPGAGHGLVGGDIDSTDTRLAMDRRQCDDHLDGRAIRVGDDARVRGIVERRQCVGVHFRHDQRHLRVHPEMRGVVDDHCPGGRGTRRMGRRYRAAGREEREIDPGEIEPVEHLHAQSPVAVGDLLACRPRAGQRHQPADRKTALDEQLQQHFADGAGGADHGDVVGPFRHSMQLRFIPRAASAAARRRTARGAAGNDPSASAPASPRRSARRGFRRRDHGGRW